jgi:hypothetical protein
MGIDVVDDRRGRDEHAIVIRKKEIVCADLNGTRTKLHDGRTTCESAQRAAMKPGRCKWLPRIDQQVHQALEERSINVAARTLFPRLNPADSD